MDLIKGETEMATKLQPDDIQIGMYVTVLEWNPQERTYQSGGPFSDYGEVVTKTFRDGSWCGDVFIVRAICLPYIIVDGEHGYTVGLDLDLRKLSLMKLTREYVEASHFKPWKD
jgi:hypothetical protein